MSELSSQTHPIRIALLGATGSIGTQTLDVIRKHPDKFELIAISANKNANKLIEIANEFQVEHVVLADESLKDSVVFAKKNDSEPLDSEPLKINVEFGAAAIEELCRLDNVDIVLNALSGEAGMRASYTTLKSNKKLALANKESLVVAGDLLMPLASHDTLLPVDSEHSAIYQCLLGESKKEMSCIWLTCSGGPFRGSSRAELSQVSAEQALAHPTWNMGKKITIDSATLMNKGLEVIEAHHLFDVPIDDVRVVVHPQSCIHSAVQYVDGSIKAHLGVADMRIPIQYALSYPHRFASPAKDLDLTELASLEFFKPDLEVFRCLKLALEAGRAGGTLPCVMNAANEVAVDYFLKGACKLNNIDECVEHTLSSFECEPVTSIEQLEDIDNRARSVARKFMDKIMEGF